MLNKKDISILKENKKESMVNVITELEKRNKELLNEIEQLKAPLQFKQLNSEEIREWIATVLSERHYTDNPDVDVVSEIMRVAHCDQENWAWFCKVYPTEAARGNVILNAFSYYPYYKQTIKLFGVRDKAKRDIFINLIKLNSEESKELFRKWLKEGKIEDNLTLKEILENGYESWNSISVSCYNHYDLRHLSLDELISSWNELTFKLDKDAKQKQELETKVQELEVKLEEKEDMIEELEERVEIEQEQVKEVVACGEKWSKNQAEDIKEKNKKLKSASEKVYYLEARVEKLEEETSQKSKKIEKLSEQLVDSELQNENLKRLDYLNSKPLPALPVEEENKILTKQSIFKRLKTKAKAKIKKMQGLIKKDKFHNQEMIAQIEIKSK